MPYDLTEQLSTEQHTPRTKLQTLAGILTGMTLAMLPLVCIGIFAMPYVPYWVPGGIWLYLVFGVAFCIIPIAMIYSLNNERKPGITIALFVLFVALYIVRLFLG